MSIFLYLCALMVVLQLKAHAAVGAGLRTRLVEVDIHARVAKRAVAWLADTYRRHTTQHAW